MCEGTVIPDTRFSCPGLGVSLPKLSLSRLENSPGLPMPPSKETRKGIGLKTKRQRCVRLFTLMWRDVAKCVGGAGAQEGQRGGKMSPARYSGGLPKEWAVRCSPASKVKGVKA